MLTNICQKQENGHISGKKGQKLEATLISLTLKVQESKVPLFILFLAYFSRNCHIPTKWPKTIKLKALYFLELLKLKKAFQFLIYAFFPGYGNFLVIEKT